MHGFKSFANKEVMKLGQGITTVVGPNGCGKTNIVDAIRWVLGEQKYSVLRSGKMEDVIKGNGKSVPVGRYGTSEEVASLVTFLCSNAASYISGTSIEVDGGQSGHI